MQKITRPSFGSSSSSVTLMRRMLRRILFLPITPADLVGSWLAKSGQSSIALEITEDSAFTWKATGEDAQRATTSRSRAGALERTAPKAPASRVLNGGGSLHGSVFRGWSLGTRASVRSLWVETVARSKFARTEFRRFAVALPLAQVGYHPRSTNASKNHRAPWRPECGQNFEQADRIHGRQNLPGS